MDSNKLTEQDWQVLSERGIRLPLTSLQLRDFLPHRYPFVMIDRITACRPQQWITALKNVTINEPYFNGHFPQQPIMPGVLMVEAMAQAAGVLSFISKDTRPADGIIYLFAGVEKVRFKRQIIPGDQLIIRAQKTLERHSIYKFDGTVHVDDELVACAQIILSEQRNEAVKSR